MARTTEAAARMTDAAAAWLDTLDGAQRELGLWPFPAEEERRSWFYTPTDHGGLALGAMRPVQQQAALRLLRSGLSRAAYVTAVTIMGLENTLDELEDFAGSAPGRERYRDPALYYVRVFGDPVPGGTWGWRFGGHHVSVNHTIVAGVPASATPCFLGANPAAAPLLGPHLLRPLGGAEDLGRELVRSLDALQLDDALLSPLAPSDLVTTNRPRLDAGGPDPRHGLSRDLPPAPRGPDDPALGRLRLSTEPRGVRATDLSGTQRELLRRLLDVYLGRLPDGLVEAEAAKLASGFDALAFGWAGSTAPGEPHYYRVQGTSLLAEYDNTQNGANHVHTVWRDLSADFGGDPLARHYATAPHGHGHTHQHGHGHPHEHEHGHEH